MRVILLLVLTLTSTYKVAAQSLSLSYVSHQIIPRKVNQVENIGGLSGITYHPKSGQYLACADKPPSRLVKFNYNDEFQEFTPISNTLLSPQPMSKSELEGIVIDETSASLFVSDEQNQGTRIFSLDSTANFKEVLLPKGSPYLELSGHNSGIEGLSLSGDKTLLYFAFERPTKSCFEEQITTIGSLNLKSGQVDLYAYKLHPVANDNLQTNGISEILWLNQNNLLVIERAYIRGTGNFVRIYETSLVNPLSYAGRAIDCEGSSLQPLPTKLVLDFVDVPQVKIDNAEGMTFNHDRSKLIIVTDDNFNTRQETQLITLKVDWQ